MENKRINKFVDGLLNMRKETAILIVIFILALVLRIIAALNTSVSADDMHFAPHAINFYSTGRLTTWDQSSGLWFAFTDIAYKIFGFTQFASRFAAILFGTFSVLLLYLLTKEFFNEKISLIAAFLLAIAPFHILNTMAEMDAMVMFFVLGAMLFFVKASKNNKLSNYALAGVFMGLAIYTKVYPLLFIPSFLIYILYVNKKTGKRIFEKKQIKYVIFFLLIAFMFTIPTLTHNYLLYKDKGFVDFQFTRTLEIGKEKSAQYYSWAAELGYKNSWKGLFLGDTRHVASGKPLLLAAIDFIRLGDPINFYLGIIGLLMLIFAKGANKKYIPFFVLSIIFILPFLASIILLPKHFMFLEILLIPFGAYFVAGADEKLSRINRNSIFIICGVILLILLILLGMPPIKQIYQPNNSPFYYKSAISQMMDYNKEIPKNSLFILDDRIYSGRTIWAFHGRPSLGVSSFINLYSHQDELEGEKVLADVYLIECARDDCGRGDIANKPDLNTSMEAFVKLFSLNGEIVKTISEPIESDPQYPIFNSENREEIYVIHHARIYVKEEIVSDALAPKQWYLYIVGYNPLASNFDYFDVYGPVGSVLYQIAHWIVTLSLILALLALLLVIYLLYRENEEHKTKEN